MTELITIPLHRTLIMNANDRHHRWHKIRQTRDLRQLACLTARTARTAPVGTLPIAAVVTYHYPTSRRPADESNLAPTTKALIDGLTDAGLWPDDRRQYVRHQDTRIADEPTRDPLGRIFARVTVTPV